MLPYHWHILPKSSDFSINGQQLNGPPTFLQEDQFANEEPEPEARFLGFCCVFLKGPGLNWLTWWNPGNLPNLQLATATVLPFCFPSIFWDGIMTSPRFQRGIPLLYVCIYISYICINVYKMCGAKNRLLSDAEVFFGQRWRSTPPQTSLGYGRMPWGLVRWKWDDFAAPNSHPLRKVFDTFDG